MFFFLECPIGSYGANCLDNCSLTCGHPGKCDRVTSHCNGGCQIGWAGVRCEEGIGRKNNFFLFQCIHVGIHLNEVD